mgnify:CR=1 FL=1
MPTSRNNVFNALNRGFSFYHFSYESKYTMITEDKKLVKLKDIQTGHFCYKNMGYDPSDQLLNLIFEDACKFSYVSVRNRIS